MTSLAFTTEPLVVVKYDGAAVEYAPDNVTSSKNFERRKVAVKVQNDLVYTIFLFIIWLHVRIFTLLIKLDFKVCG